MLTGQAIKAGDAYWEISARLDKLRAGLAQGLAGVKGATAKIVKHSRAIGIGFTIAGGIIVGALGAAVVKAATFSEAMAEVNTLGVKDLGALEDAVKDVSVEFGLGLTDAAKAAYQAISAGASEAETPLLLERAAKAATAGISDLTTAIELGTSVSNAFGKEIANVNEIYDQAFLAVKDGVTNFGELAASLGKVSPLFAAAGLKSEEMFASIAALTKGGLATAEAVTGMKAALTNIIKPTKEATDLAAALGVEFNASALRTKGLKGFLDDLGTAIRDRGPELTKYRQQIEAQMASGAKSNEAVRAQIETLKRQKEQIKGTIAALKANGQAYGQYETQLRRIDAQLKQTSGGLKITKSDLKKLKNEFKSLAGVSEDTLTMFAGLFGGIEGLGAVLALTGNQADAFSETLDKMAQAQGATDEAFERFVDANPAFAFQQLRSAMEAMAVEIGQTLLPILRDLARGIMPILETIRHWIAAHPKLSKAIVIATAAIGALMLVVGPLLIALPALVAAFGIVSTAIAAVGAPVIAVVAAIAVLVAAVVAGVVAIVFHWTETKQFFSDLWRDIKYIFAKGLQLVGKIAGAGMRFVVKAITDPVGTIKEVWDWIVGVFDAAVGKIKGAMDWLVGILQKAFNAVKNFFGFLGSNFGGGFSEGIKGLAVGGMIKSAGLVSVHKDETLLLPAGAEVLPRQHSAQGAAMMGGGGGGVTIENINVTINADHIDNPRELARLLEPELAEIMATDLRGMGAMLAWGL